MTGDARLAMVRQAEIAATKRREEQERRVQKRLVELIKKYNLKIRVLEEEVRVLWQKEQELISKGKNLRAKWIGWRRKRKQIQLEDLKRVTPSIKSQ